MLKRFLCDSNPGSEMEMKPFSNVIVKFHESGDRSLILLNNISERLKDNGKRMLALKENFVLIKILLFELRVYQ